MFNKIPFNQMKFFFTVLLCACSFTIFAQKKPGYFYKSPEDYYNHNPIKNVTWDPESYSYNLSEKVKITRGSEEQIVRLTEIGENWASNENGMLMRFYENKWYLVVVDGQFTYYIHWQHGDAVPQKDGSYEFIMEPQPVKDRFAMSIDDYYSMTLHGELIKWGDKKFDQYLDKLGLKKQYASEVPNLPSPFNMLFFINYIKNKNVRYMKLANEKSAKK